ncbi:hypothetical protein [Methanococcoides sp. AM1]|uniref:hypothetical protein n=1 Tax=Methanococcoides sp. AM1 TaxID=1201011 RepID=UPI001083A8D0|nr:hypothetical protein [Methanococcoides sp. AM1]
MVIDSSKLKYAEWLEESAFGTAPTDGTWKQMSGRILDVSFKGGAKIDEYSYLPGASASDPLGSSDAEKVGEEMSVGITLNPTDWTLLPVILSADTLSSYVPGDTKNYISLGMLAGSEYGVMSGGVISNYQFSCNFGERAEVSVDIPGAKFSGWTTDYIGTGAHSTVPSGILVWDDISAITYDSAALSTEGLILDSLKFTIEQPADPVGDLSSALDSGIADWDYGPRKISVELGVSLTDMSIDTDIFAGADHTLAFTAMSKTLTFSNLKWANAPDRKLSAADKLGMTLSSSATATLAIA